ncbi:GNAT family N-acetyltransferase [Colwellia sp. MEBiC06753]
MQLTHQFVAAISEISVTKWRQCFPSGQPFTQYGYLLALEQSKSVCGETGWQPIHLEVLTDKQEIVAILPLYIKSHSYGEYLFDWSWADAYHQHGIDYYPKLVTAIPFTPVTGQRLGINQAFSQNTTDIISYITELLAVLAKQINAQTSQCLFIDNAGKKALTAQGWLGRSDIQYHWFNRNYQSFDDFLALFTARKRKNIIKERQKVIAQHITIERLLASDVTEQLWQQFYSFYCNTYLKRSGHHGYLTLEFFKQLTEVVPTQTLVIFAYHQGELVAGSLFFFDENTLYGRYWGCNQAFDFLHFELCYYQGIEYCIKRQLTSFNAGAQGQHKIKRGFEPVFIHGCYQIYHPSFNAAISQFLTKERHHNKGYYQAAKAALPYKAAINESLLN